MYQFRALIRYLTIEHDAFDLLTDDKQLSDEDKEADEDKELLYPIALETDWTKLDEWFNNHGLEQGFTHSEKDKEDVEGIHNHELVENIGMVTLRYRKLNPKMHNDVKLLATCEVRASAIIEMRPSQLQLWGQFHDVVLLDTTAKMNRYSMILCVIILIDNYNRSHLAATALLSDETKDTFSCIIFPVSYLKKLGKHFLGKYGGEKWKNFFGEFCRAHNSHVESIFEEKWNALLQNYADAANYLQCQLYPCREAWVLCFAHCAFNAEAKESHFICHNEAIGKLPVGRVEDYHVHFFKKIDMSCQRFLTTALFKLQHHEMNQSMHYRCYSANLKEELERKFTIETPNGIFSEDMFDTTPRRNDTEATMGKGFGIMKKVLNLAITTGRVEELYEIYEKFSKELESEMAQTVQGNDVTEFAHTISNPLSIRTKGQKPKNVNGVDKVNLELNEGAEGEGESSESKSKRCGVCNQEGYNAQTCSNRKKSTGRLEREN
ncbi:hypothetical protein RhiirA4_472057 [Rhizophagus irregularis]|uniref:MULE transposase domain-containing protein n=1 Tax=Rhizophagus irregularis TaxID=588596 RepID=A0A2I1H483_9GLOM|nr:hypothetical protein RhiirA4_472057 [Rhizophagus irregularis]